MRQKSLKRLIINQFIKFRRFNNRYAMVQFVKKNWFVVGLVILGMAYFRKEIKTYFKAEALPSQEKFTQAPTADKAGQSLFGVGNEAATGGTSIPMPDISAPDAKSFLLRFGKVAKGEHEKYKIPASAFLALAYVNSHAGQRAIVGEGHNYFARLCGSNWDGERIEIGSTCFRQYAKPWDSFRDASSQLSATRWAQTLVKEKDTKWEHWVKAFAENGYSDVKNAEEEMVKVIRAYRLFELD